MMTDRALWAMAGTVQSRPSLLRVNPFIFWRFRLPEQYGAIHFEARDDRLTFLWNHVTAEQFGLRALRYSHR